MRRLVATADDLGLAPGTTDGALDAHDRGILTAASVAAVGADVERAAARVRERPGLDAGAHLVLVGERPLSPPAEVPSLLGRDGALLPGYGAFLRRYLRGAVDPLEVERELERQIARLRELGLRLVHLNSHQHLHALPRLVPVVLRLARAHGIPFVRLPADPAAARSLSARALALRVLNRLGRRARRELSGGVMALDRTLGLLAAGRLDARRLEALLGDVRGTCELVCHPGLGREALARRYDWGYSWEGETAALTDPALAARLRQRSIEVLSFSRLAG